MIPNNSTATLELTEDAPVHPGQVLQAQFLTPREITPYRLAKSVGVQQTRIAAILDGKRSVTADTAARLAQFFPETTAEYWLELQSKYDLATQISLKPGPLTISSLEVWLWDAACTIRGATEAPKFKDYILPLLFFKRLCDVFDDEFAAQAELFGSEEDARAILKEDHDAALQNQHTPIVRFYVPETASWRAARSHPADGKLGEFVTDCLRTVAQSNPELQGVLDVRDFNERQAGQRLLDDDRLAHLMEVLSRHLLGLDDTRPDVLGQAYEYLLRKFAEGQGQSAGEFYTPPEVSFLMGRLLDPAPFSTVYDPTCGSGGLLLKPRLVFEQTHPDKKSQAPQLFGQELNPVTYAIAKMNMLLHDFGGSQIAVGDTFRAPQFGAAGAGLKRFDYVVANPMWNQDNFKPEVYEADADKWKRFDSGIPPASSADWGWAQHILASLKDGGQAAVVLDTGAVSRGSGSENANKEKAIRQKFVENDWIEGVILLPENLFYNTTAPGIVLLLRKGKPVARSGQMLLVNASQFFVKRRPKNVLSDDGAREICDVFAAWETRPKVSRVLSLDDMRAADFNLSPSQFVEVGTRAVHRSLPEILVAVSAANSRRAEADAHLSAVLSRLGLTESEARP